MQILVYLLPVQLTVSDVPFRENVHHLAHFHMEILPHLRVIFDEGTFDGLLSDDEIGFDLRIGPALEIPEIAFCEERHLIRNLMVVILLAEDILFLKRIPFAESLNDIVQHNGIGEILVCVRTVLLHRVLHLNDDRTVPLSGKQYRIKMLSMLILHIL